MYTPSEHRWMYPHGDTCVSPSHISYFRHPFQSVGAPTCVSHAPMCVPHTHLVSLWEHPPVCPPTCVSPTHMGHIGYFPHPPQSVGVLTHGGGWDTPTIGGNSYCGGRTYISHVFHCWYSKFWLGRAGCQNQKFF